MAGSALLFPTFLVLSLVHFDFHFRWSWNLGCAKLHGLPTFPPFP